jgi:choline dehydrogenase
MQEAFDYIVVGAGSAGCVIVDRLSADSSATVLVLEAGGRDSNPWIHVPIGYSKTFFDKRVNWCFDSEPCPGLNGRSLYMPSGKVLGGSSSINGLLYVRGQAQDYDDWEQLGNDGWAWKDVLPYYVRSEDQEWSDDDAYHGHGGPLAVSCQTELHPLCDAFLQSGESAGFRQVKDFNRGDQEGLGWFQVTARAGRRKSAAVSFLRRAEKRPNVQLQIHAHVASIVIESAAASGVVYEQNGQKHEVRARRAVVVSSGAINSPALLQRSGIGNPEWLREAGVPVKHSLPGVGANYQDHFQAKLVYRCKDRVTLNDSATSPLRKVRMGVEYLVRRRGPLTTAGAQSGGFVCSSLSPGRPDIQFHVFTYSSKNFRDGLDDFSGMTISACQLRPHSRGSVRVRGPKWSDAPLISPNFLDSDLDQRTMVEGLRMGRKIAEREPLRERLVAEERPGTVIRDDEALLGYVRETGGSVFHPVGTCRMGNNAMSVVDSQLRVHGIERLMVADASVMPTIVSGNTNAASIMIGERAVDFLRKQSANSPPL